jgi:hypothetical protein
MLPLTATSLVRATTRSQSLLWIVFTENVPFRDQDVVLRVGGLVNRAPDRTSFDQELLIFLHV